MSAVMKEFWVNLSVIKISISPMNIELDCQNRALKSRQCDISHHALVLRVTKTHKAKEICAINYIL
jgi:hypothetical protein